MHAKSLGFKMKGTCHRLLIFGSEIQASVEDFRPIT